MSDEERAEGGSEAGGPRLLSVADVAGPAIARIRSWAGLLGFAAAFVLGLRGGAPLATTCLHAVAAGVVASTVAWGAAVTAYRHLLRARVRAALRRPE